MEILFFSRLMFITATSPLVLCMYKLASNLFLFLDGHGSGQFKEVVFVLPVGLYAECKITTAHPILTNKFKNISLRTFT